jgi:cycloeucalenol cycloisomerase
MTNIRLFSSNGDKAWVEKFFLIYSPVWMGAMAVLVMTGWGEHFGNSAMLLSAAVIALPALLIPMVLAPRFTSRKWHESYWFKANLYLFIFGFFGNYVGSAYFFDVLGMVYHYSNVTSHLEATLVGHSGQVVPVVMYFYTHVYFMTYHTTATIALRVVRQLRLPAMWLVFPLAVFAIGYFWAFMETKAMANPMLASSFYYRRMDLMLKYGSAIYATYFIASFPIYCRIDEGEGQSWSLWQTGAAACSASMLTFYMLDFAARFIGSLGA